MSITAPGSIFRNLTKVLILSLLSISVSCTTVFFDRPQPVDSKNLKNIPKELQGIWNHSSEKASIVMNASACQFISYEEHAYAKKLIDTSAFYKIENDKIFSAQNNFATGIPFKMLNDTIHFTASEEEIFVLSDNALLRPAKNCYIFNIKRIGPAGRPGDWWEVCIIQKAGNGEISIYYPSGDDLLKTKPNAYLKLAESTKKSNSTLPNDTVFCQAEFESKNIAKFLISKKEKPLYLLKPDSTFYLIGEELKSK